MNGGRHLGARDLALAVIAVAGLAACTAPTPYQPAIDGYGYAEQQLEDNRYRVTFAGNAETPRDVVQNYLLFRAAELTLETGHDWFTTAGQNIERSTRYFGTVDPTFPSARVWSRHDYPFSTFGTATYTTHAIDSYTAFADIVMFEGEKPSGDVNAYDARDVIEQLRPVVARAPAAG